MRGLIFGGLVGGVSGVVIGLLLGVAIAQGFSFFQSGGVSIPYDTQHSDIANQITVYDTTVNAKLDLKHVQTGPAEFYPYAPMQAFRPRATYTQSLWVWCSKEDIDVSMVIVGPGDDGKSFLIDFGRHMYNAVEIKGFGQVSTWAEGTTEEISWWTVVLP